MYYKGGNYDWVIMNTKKKMSLPEVFEWFGSKDCEALLCYRQSDRGARDVILVLGSGHGYGAVGESKDYITDTGLGYGGKGAIHIKSVFRPGDRIVDTKKYTIWVFK